MRPLFPRAFALVATLALTAAASADTAPSTDKLGKKVEHVNLAEVSGKLVKLDDLKDKKAVVVVFMSFECPVSNSYAPRLAELVKLYGDRGVAFFGVCPCDMSAAELEKQRKEFKLPFGVVRDENLAVAEAFKAGYTPEAFVLDRFGIMRYRGRIDNSFAARLKKNNQTTQHDLMNALDDVLAKKSVRVPATKPIGCPIPEKESGDRTAKGPTYHKDVLPILQTNCLSCHRAGEVGPFALTSYKQAVNWASDIKDYTQDRRMPPWKPTEGPEFAGARKLGDKDIATLAAWVDAGTPEGDPKDAPPPAKFPDGWMLGKPDLILTVQDDMQVGPSGHDLFRCFVLPTNLTEDKYIIGMEVRPGNPRVVHHTLNFFDNSGEGRKLEKQEKDRGKKAGEEDLGPGYSVAMGVGFRPAPRADGKPPFGGLGGWAPGSLGKFLPEGSGYYLPAGSDIIVQAHYHRTGKPEKDRTSIGLYFAKGKVDKPYRTVTVPGNFMFLPPGKDLPVKGSVWLTTDCTLYSVMPHMHLLGKSVKVTMTPPDGKTETLVAIKDWDYNWQETYFFKKAIPAKAGTRIDIEAVYDNSSDNPNNPHNPPAYVKVGEQTTDEMLFGFIGATTDTPGVKQLASPKPAKAEADKPKPADKDGK